MITIINNNMINFLTGGRRGRYAPILPLTQTHTQINLLIESRQLMQLGCMQPACKNTQSVLGKGRHIARTHRTRI